MGQALVQSNALWDMGNELRIAFALRFAISQRRRVAQFAMMSGQEGVAKIILYSPL